ncbi:MAG TPA: hypothetical protein VES60_08130 [Nakamurella sp.]|nr:hypothetical protein [Nakamurella sp.]
MSFRWPTVGRRGRVFDPLAVLAAALVMSGCTASNDPNPATTTTTATTTTPVSITPVTPDGLVTGPGISDSTITLGLLVDAERDRGFTQGVTLWRDSVNASGGLCGRSVQIMANGAAGVPADAPAAYNSVGRSTLGLMTLPAVADSATLTTRISADQIPALSPTGTSAQLGPSRPIVVGATDDILAINALDYLAQSGRLDEGATVGVLTDQSPSSTNALVGARWWGGLNEVTLDVRTVDAGADPPDWGDDVPVVLTFTDPQTTARVAATTPPTTTVVTSTDGYDPAQWGEAGLSAARAGRVLVSLPTPAIGSDYPAAAVVTAAFAKSGGTDPGPRLLAGYATAAIWTRLLTQACADRALTRTEIELAATTTGASSVESLFGPSDPALPIKSALPATRVSAMATANPDAPAGMTPLTWLEGASGIDSYQP